MVYAAAGLKFLKDYPKYCESINLVVSQLKSIWKKKEPEQEQSEIVLDVTFKQALDERRKK